MRFTPVLFASAVAAAGYYPAPVASSSSAAHYGGDYDNGAWPKPTSSAAAHYDPGYNGGSWGKSSSSSSAVWSHKGGPKKSKTTTVYETQCYTETKSSSTKVWTSVKAHPTVCDEDDEWENNTWVHKGDKTSAKSTPYSPVKPTGGAKNDVPYCPAVTETCTVTVTATKGGEAPAKPTGSAEYPSKPDTPAAPVKPSGGADSWPNNGGSYTAKPVTSSKVYSPVMATANAGVQNGMAGAAAIVAAVAYIL